MMHPHCCETGETRFGPAIGRRKALLGLGAALSLGRPLMALAAAAPPPRLIVINTRGGLDGLSLVAPYGDPNLMKLRGQIVAPAVGQPGGMLDLGGFYGLHPAMPNLHAMYAQGQAAFVHAVGNAGFTRSHFEGQDYLQSGAPELLTSGWLNRVMGLVQAAPGAGQSGITLSACAPLLAQGPTIVAGWAPDPFPRMSAALMASLGTLLQADPLLGPAFQVGVADRSAFNAALAASPFPHGQTPLQKLAWAAGAILAAPNGPRIATIETESYDTHSDQVARLNVGMADLDGALLALKTALGSAWASTVVMTMTEFGRTAYANGDSTCGTDHGTAFAVILAGGAVHGGRVVADWPGLAPTQLDQGRDLAPTVDIRAIAGSILADHLGVPSAAMAGIFPNATIIPIPGLVS
jgi:uncharacterized protein (DUF1501 family)